jgi:modulator of FtsH protease
MTDQVRTYDASGYGYVVSQEQRNKVLRNTYWVPGWA